MIYFTSDTHYFHRNILQYDNRPWATIEDMHEGLIQRWNERVTEKDCVFHLGDVSFGQVEETVTLLARLKGQVIFIKGNHDKRLQRVVEKLPPRFSIWPDRLYSFAHEKRVATLCHYPFLTWDRQHYGAWMLHGHSHGRHDAINQLFCRLDVGVSARHTLYAPISIDEVAAIMECRKNERISRSLQTKQTEE